MMKFISSSLANPFTSPLGLNTAFEIRILQTWLSLSKFKLGRILVKTILPAIRMIISGLNTDTKLSRREHPTRDARRSDSQKRQIMRLFCKNLEQVKGMNHR